MTRFQCSPKIAGGNLLQVSSSRVAGFFYFVDCRKSLRGPIAKHVHANESPSQAMARRNQNQKIERRKVKKRKQKKQVKKPRKLKTNCQIRATTGVHDRQTKTSKKIKTYCPQIRATIGVHNGREEGTRVSVIPDRLGSSNGAQNNNRGGRNAGTTSVRSSSGSALAHETGLGPPQVDRATYSSLNS